MIAEPRALATAAADPVVRTLARLTCVVTEAPWTLGAADLAQARAAGLSDESILQTVLLSACFGHLNRVADAVGIELDYEVQLTPPHAVPTTPPYHRPPPADWPDPDAEPALAIALRPGATALLAALRSHALERDAPLDRRQRALIARVVAECLGDAATVRALTSAGESPPAQALVTAAEAATPLDQALVTTAKGVTPLDQALVTTAEEVTLAPFRLGAGTVARLQAAGLTDDTAIFDAIATAAVCTICSRIAVALAALSR